MGQIEMFMWAFLPAAILAVLIYKADNLRREPKWLVALTFAAGVGVAWTVEAGLGLLEPKDCRPETMSLIAKLWYSLCDKALWMELAKCAALFLLSFRNKAFDEYVDGFVYAGALALGFVGFESIGAISAAGDNMYAVGLGRTLFDIPAHTLCAATMGYFFSRWKLGKSPWNLLWALLTSVLAHTLFDTAGLYGGTTGYVITFVALTEAILMIIGFVYLAALIRSHRLKDEETVQ